jgi:predicted Zn-dependent peptidase
MNEIEINGLNEKIYTTTLDNGLNIVMWVNNNSKMFYSTLSVKYGSINTLFKIGNKTYNTPYGIAHYIEHLKFNISDNLTMHEVFNKMGCDTNAFTTFNYTNYLVMGSNDAILATNKLLECVETPYFTKKLINKERNIIISESNMGLDDPYMLNMYGILKNIFKREEDYSLITGVEEDIKKITLEDINLVYNAYYHPSNMNLVITGNFNPYEMYASIRDNQSKKKFNTYLNPLRIKEYEPKKVIKKYDEIESNSKCIKIKIAIKSRISDYKKMDIIKVLTLGKILMYANFGSTSVVKNYLLDNELINNMHVNVDKMDESILYIITIDTNYYDLVLDKINNTLDNLSIDESTFNRIKKANLATLILNFEDIEVVNDIFQNELINFNEVITNKVELLNNISYKDILEFISLIDVSNRTTMVVKPYSK